MRYYIYLDKCLLRSLFSVLSDSNFDIEVVEYSVRKSSTVNNQVEVDPYTEDLCESENGKTKEVKSIQRRFRKSNFKKHGVRGNVGHSNSSTVETQRRYINIEDITDMKNNTFYHNLVEKLNKTSRNEERIAIEIGYIEPYIREDIFNNNSKKGNNGFFLINNKYVWYDKDMLQGDIELLAQMSCKIKVVGYTMSCLEKEERIIKAIAIFIE